MHACKETAFFPGLKLWLSLLRYICISAGDWFKVILHVLYRKSSCQLWNSTAETIMTLEVQVINRLNCLNSDSSWTLKLWHEQLLKQLKHCCVKLLCFTWLVLAFSWPNYNRLYFSLVFVKVQLRLAFSVIPQICIRISYSWNGRDLGKP